MSTTGNIVLTSADIGPGESVAALTLSDVRELRYDFPNDRMQVILQDGSIRNFDYSTLATITHVIAAGVATVTVAK